MISLGNKKNGLRCSQPSMKSAITIGNENGPVMKAKLVLQRAIGAKRQAIVGGIQPRAFGRNIANLPLLRKSKNDFKLKQDLKEEVARMRKPLTAQSSIPAVSTVALPAVVDTSEAILEQPAPMAICETISEPMIIDSKPMIETSSPCTDPQVCAEYVSEIDTYLRKIEPKFF